MTSLWTDASAALGHDPSSLATRQKIVIKNRFVPMSDRTRAPRPQIETPQAIVVLLALLSPDAPTMSGTHAYFAWNLPVSSKAASLEALASMRAGLAGFGLELPNNQDLRFGPFLCTLLEVSLRAGGRAWLETTCSEHAALQLWSGSRHAAVQMNSGTLLEFELSLGLRDREAVAQRRVRADVPRSVFWQFARFVWQARMRAAELGVTIPTQETLDALRPKSGPDTPPDPFAGGGQEEHQTPENRKAGKAPPSPAPYSGHPSTAQTSTAQTPLEAPLNKAQNSSVCVKRQTRMRVPLKGGQGSTLGKGTRHDTRHTPP